jgi:glycosyltransferase involved in cell wall biosynthesis
MWLIDVAFMRTLIRIWNPRLIAVDIYMRDYVARRYGREKEEVAVIPLGVDLGEPRSTEDRTVRDELNLGDRPIILSLGHVTPLRHRTLLVEALPSILETNPDAVLLVVGKVYDDLFLKRAEELGVADHVITTGAVPFERVPAYFAAANVECHEEGRGSGLGTATLEAMATGVPVVAVASADSFAGMTLTSWEDIVLVERPDAGLLATAISKLFADPDAARTVGEGGRRLIASRFTTDISTADHVQLYEELITAKARKLT